MSFIRSVGLDKKIIDTHLLIGNPRKSKTYILYLVFNIYLAKLQIIVAFSSSASEYYRAGKNATFLGPNTSIVRFRGDFCLPI